MNRFRDKTAVITGAASGLGRGLAEALAVQGARVIISDLNATGAEEVAADLCRRGLEAHPVACDVTSPGQVERLYQAAEQRYGPLDYSFANAGFAMAGLTHELTAEHFEEVLAVNLMGVIRCCQAAYVRMQARRRGHLVNTASLAGLVGFPGMVPYSTSKAAVVRYSLDLRLEARQYGVKVTVLCPAFLRTGIFAACRSINMDLPSIERTLPLPISPLEPGVRALLRGVERNLGVVTYPWFATTMWWINRLSLGLSQPLSQLVLNSIQAGHRRG